MEAFLVILMFVFYILFRLLLGHHKTELMRDKIKYAVGINLLRKKDFNGALVYFEEMTRKYPESALAWAFKGQAQLGLQNYYLCLACCKKAIELEDRLTEAYLHKGFAFFHLENYREAWHEFDKSLWYSKEKNCDAFRQRGICSYYLGEYSKAASDLKRAVLMGDENANHFLMTVEKRLNVN